MNERRGLAVPVLECVEARIAQPRTDSAECRRRSNDRKAETEGGARGGVTEASFLGDPGWPYGINTLALHFVVPVRIFLLPLSL